MSYTCPVVIQATAFKEINIDIPKFTPTSFHLFQSYEKLRDHFMTVNAYMELTFKLITPKSKTLKIDSVSFESLSHYCVIQFMNEAAYK